MDIVYNTMIADTFLIDFIGSPRVGEREINTTFTVSIEDAGNVQNTMDDDSELVIGILAS